MKNQHIRCTDCRFAVVDTNLSDYTRKQCRTCAAWETCEVCAGCKLRDECKARKKSKRAKNCDRKRDTPCSNQQVKWAAFVCGCSKSEYSGCTLNMSINGNKLREIAWSGCKFGEVKE